MAQLVQYPEAKKRKRHAAQQTKGKEKGNETIERNCLAERGETLLVPHPL